jgi:hypothetical protein
MIWLSFAQQKLGLMTTSRGMGIGSCDTLTVWNPGILSGSSGSPSRSKPFRKMLFRFLQQKKYGIRPCVYLGASQTNKQTNRQAWVNLGLFKYNIGLEAFKI